MNTLFKKTVSAIVLSFFIQQAAFAAESVLPAAEVAPVAVITPISSPDELISVEFNEADIQSAFKILALKGNVNIVASPEVMGKVTMQLRDVPWMNAFETIVKTYGFSYEKKGNIYEILTPESLKERREEAEVLVREVFSLNYAQIEQVTAALKKVLSKVSAVEPIAGTNQIVITDEAGKMESIRKLMKEIDTKMPQVHIETKIVRTTLNKSETMGIDWNTTAGLRGATQPTTFPFSPHPEDNHFSTLLQRYDALPIGQTAQESTVSTTSGGGQSTESTVEFPSAHGFPFVQPEDFRFGTIDFNQFSAVFNLLASRKSTKIVSNPRIVVMNHQSARIQVGEEIGIPMLERNETTGAFEVSGFEPRNTGIVLNVTPHISKKSEVLLRLRPEVTKFIGFEAITDTNLTSPRFETIVAETTVLVHSGDTLVIGGLISEEDSDAKTRVPFLGSLPVAGWLFKHTSPQNSRTETIFFITVVLADDVYNKKALEEWRKAQKAFADYRAQGDEEFKSKKKKSEKK
ncbi:MAG: hypothetical protein KBC91_00105 [Candidatus Omnitrophica bacterium]|nr:hypothetical protein [Candidatus Omnitrophota bacterium]